MRVPVKLSSAWLNTSTAERHATLQNNGHILQDLQDRLIQSQVRTDHIRGAVAAAPQPALALDVDDLYSDDEPILLRAGLRDMDLEHVRRIRARVQNAATKTVVYEADFVPTGDGWVLKAPPLPADTYRVELIADTVGTAAPASVQDVFDVAAAASCAKGS